MCGGHGLKLQPCRPGFFALHPYEVLSQPSGNPGSFSSQPCSQPQDKLFQVEVSAPHVPVQRPPLAWYIIAGRFLCSVSSLDCRQDPPADEAQTSTHPDPQRCSDQTPRTGNNTGNSSILRSFGSCPSQTLSCSLRALVLSPRLPRPPPHVCCFSPRF